MLTKPSDGRRDLNNWAQEVGYSSFETYLATGGTLEGARDDLERRMQRIASALEHLRRYTEQPRPAGGVVRGGIDEDGRVATIGPEALARLEADTAGEPVDTANAQVQGAEHE